MLHVIIRKYKKITYKIKNKKIIKNIMIIMSSLKSMTAACMGILFDYVDDSDLV